MTPRVGRALRTAVLALVCAAGLMATARAQTQVPDDFKPVSSSNPIERLPATPYIYAAYGVAWAAVLIYVIGLSRKLGKVEQELASLSRRAPGGHAR